MGLLLLDFGSLEGETDIDECGDGLHGWIMLAGFKEVVDALFVVRVPACRVEAAEFGIGRGRWIGIDHTLVLGGRTGLASVGRAFSVERNGSWEGEWSQNGCYGGMWEGDVCRCRELKGCDTDMDIEYVCIDILEYDDIGIGVTGKTMKGVTQDNSINNRWH